MTHLRIFLLPLFFATFFSCSNYQAAEKEQSDDDETTSVVEKADKIEYFFQDASMAPEYHRSYTISVTTDSLNIYITSYSDTLRTVNREFTKAKFEAVKARLKNLQKHGEIDEGKIPTGGTSTGISLYKNNKSIFEGVDYGWDNKNFKGADIDLTYLVPDLKELVDATRAKNNQ